MDYNMDSALLTKRNDHHQDDPEVDYHHKGDGYPAADHEYGGHDDNDQENGGLLRRTCSESKKLWYIAGPAILTSVLQYSLAAITQTVAGHIGPIELAAVAIQNLAISGIGFGAMTGMGSALETLSGQAFGAGQLYMLGIYLQRSWIILICTAVVMSLIYIFSTPILILLHQNREIAVVAGRFSKMMLPQLFAFAINAPMQKFLQSQSKVVAMAWISGVVVVLHAVLSWLFIIKLGLGLVGAAITLNLAWWLVNFALFVYITIDCVDTWSGFSWLAFRDLWGFVKLSMASAIMLWLEYWFIMLLLVLIGALKNAEIPLAAASICLNLDGWYFMVTLGFLIAISVRVSNELGAGRPKAAKFSVVVAVFTSLSIGIVVMVVILTTRKVFPALFTDDEAVKAEVRKISSLLAISVILSSIQPVLSGMAVGAGWQSVIAWVNIGCYLVVGLTSGVVMGYKFHLGVQGLWGGVLIGFFVQIIILLIITWKTDWKREVSLAKERIAEWGGTSVVASTD
ncbi:Multi antimicrobial extrusion protein [Macleaya cordata]|uniref:Protein DETOXIFICATION n=1 Tax=Macleaya cordata TaxID=56857 RepID=A0A200PR90_MACCD|nr:Multi antimicrobial extrusion protein [Macleaya cordata]